MGQGSSWEIYSCPASPAIPAFYRTWSFITVFTGTHHFSLSWTKSVQPKTFQHIS